MSENESRACFKTKTKSEKTHKSSNNHLCGHDDTGKAAFRLNIGAVVEAVLWWAGAAVTAGVRTASATSATAATTAHTSTAAAAASTATHLFVLKQIMWQIN